MNFLLIYLYYILNITPIVSLSTTQIWGSERAIKSKMQTATGRLMKNYWLFPLLCKFGETGYLPSALINAWLNNKTLTILKLESRPLLDSSGLESIPLCFRMSGIDLIFIPAVHWPSRVHFDSNSCLALAKRNWFWLVFQWTKYIFWL